jgi:aryl-alcohol dehydrogenase-like predicted oxidoreductase
VGACAKTLDCSHSGTTKIHRLEENLGAMDVELTPEDIREIDVVASKISVQGERYPESAQRMINR